MIIRTSLPPTRIPITMNILISAAPSIENQNSKKHTNSGIRVPAAISTAHPKPSVRSRTGTADAAPARIRALGIRNFRTSQKAQSKTNTSNYTLPLFLFIIRTLQAICKYKDFDPVCSFSTKKRRPFRDAF